MKKRSPEVAVEVVDVIVGDEQREQMTVCRSLRKVDLGLVGQARHAQKCANKVYGSLGVL